MPKLKTRKSASKRIKINAKGTITHRRAGQDHFNARESGTITKRKRRDHAVSRSNVRTIRKLMPY